MIVICSIEITEYTETAVSSAEFMSQDLAAGEIMEFDTTISELGTQDITFEDSDI